MASPSINEEHLDQEKDSDSSKRDEVLLNVMRPDYERPAAPPAMEPLYDLTDSGKVCGKYLYLPKLAVEIIKNGLSTNFFETRISLVTF